MAAPSQMHRKKYIYLKRVHPQKKLSEGYVMHYILLTRENFLAKPFKDIICVFFQCSSYRNNKASAINLKAAFCWACSLCSEVAPTLHAACCMLHAVGVGCSFQSGIKTLCHISGSGPSSSYNYRVFFHFFSVLLACVKILKREPFGQAFFFAFLARLTATDRQQLPNNK